MMILFVILAIVISVVLCLIVLIQNPKGGGLAGSFAGFSNQFMGVKQTTDVLEKGTWVFGGLIAVLCLASAFFIPSNVTAAGTDSDKFQNAPLPNSNTPANSIDLNQGQQATPDSQPKP
ncbi:MAG: preprotein translocase subunit SecG [Chitinophagaceae bacterium]|jgi:preprotein translocase subunit SecG